MSERRRLVDRGRERPGPVPVPEPPPSAEGAAPNPPLFALRDVVKSYGRDAGSEGPALDVEHLDLPGGEIVAILGYSGSGKSTLLNILGLLDEPDPDPATHLVYRGRWSFLGDDGVSPGVDRLDGRTAARLRREEFGFVFQTGELLANLDVESNIALPLHLNRRGGDTGPTVTRLLAEIDLPPYQRGRRPNQLSVGEAQRVAFARAIVHDPAVLFADEPTGNLDAAHAANLMRIIRGWCTGDGGDRRSVVWVTHNIALAAEYADRILILADGRVVDTIDNRGPRRIDPDELFRRLQSRTRTGAHAQPHGTPSTVGAPAAHVTNDGSPGCRGSHLPLWFVRSFALQDLFPPASTLLGRVRNGVGSLLGVTVTTVLLVMVLLMMRGAISLERYLENSFVDPRINSLRVTSSGLPGYRDEFSHADVVAIRSMGWGSAQGERRLVVPPPGSTAGSSSGGVVQGAYGVYNRQMSFEEPGSIVGRRITLRYYAMDLEDPVLATIPVMEGTEVSELAEGDRRVHSLFQAAHTDEGHCEGIVLSLAGLQALGLTRVPDTVPAFDTTVREHIPVLGVASWLPAGKDFVMECSWFQHRYKAGRPLARLPSFDLLLVYPEDIFNAWPIVAALDDAAYAVDTDILERLDWVRSTSRFVDLAAWFFIAVVCSVAMVSAFLTCTQNVRRKRSELGILLAFGAPSATIRLVYLVEAALLFALAALAATAAHVVTGPLFENAFLAALHGANPEAEQLRALFAAPTPLLPSVLAAALAAILLTTWLATERSLRGLSIAELIRFRE